ncbi:MAG: AAA family ATPase [Bacteroidetes bacterium]|nr:AAA family ATPase [Bacteroidota bacterium]
MAKNPFFLGEVIISNFKSIAGFKIAPARVNIFIGKPNSGKSNLLEALCMIGMPVNSGDVLGSGWIRLNGTSSLFYHQNIDVPVVINTKSIFSESIALIHRDNSYVYNYVGKQIKSTTGKKELVSANNSTTVEEGLPIFMNGIEKISHIRRYQFSSIPNYQELRLNSTVLNFSGDNLWSIISKNASLKEFASSFFKEFGLEVLYDKKTGRMDIMQRQGDSYYLIDFSMTPDTFQRMLYYLAAIESNKTSVLLFEEPEAQSYPPYIQMLAERIIDDESNQYFITTHSPFVVEKMMERAGVSDDVKIFITYYEDYQTKVRELSQQDVIEIMDNNVDLFFNMEAYQKR